MDIWDCPPGEERVESFKAPVTGKRLVVYRYCTKDGFCFATVAPTAEIARVVRDVRLEALGRTVPKREHKGLPKPIPASECCESRCNELGRRFEATA